MATLTVYADYDKYILSYSTSSYSAARAGASFSVEDIEYIHSGQFKDVGGSLWRCYESPIRYDTSALGDADIVTAVSEYLYLTLNECDTVGFVDQSRSYDFGDEITSADWVAGDDLAALTLLSSFTIETSTPTGLKEFPSSSNFVAAVNTTGYTYTMHSSSRLEAGNTPSDDESIRWGSASSGSFRPRLVITYTPATAGTGEIQAPTAQLSGVGTVTITGTGAVTAAMPQLLGAGFAGAPGVVYGVGSVRAAMPTLDGVGGHLIPQEMALDQRLTKARLIQWLGKTKLYGG